MPKISPFLWFADNNCEEAVNYYVSVFPNSRILDLMRYPDTSSFSEHAGMAGKVLTIVFELDGQRVMGLDGGPHFRFTEAISLLVECKDQGEIDYYWEKLSHHPESEQCGWCKDRFGLSWQIVPAASFTFTNPRVMAALLEMKKIEIARLEAAGRDSD